SDRGRTRCPCLQCAYPAATSKGGDVEAAVANKELGSGRRPALAGCTHERCFARGPIRIGNTTVSQDRPIEPFAVAAEKFNRQSGRVDGAAVAQSLDAGLNVLRDAFYARVHDDVEKLVGMDSMLMPVSEEK